MLAHLPFRLWRIDNYENVNLTVCMEDNHQTHWSNKPWIYWVEFAVILMILILASPFKIDWCEVTPARGETADGQVSTRLIIACGSSAQLALSH